MGQKKVIKSKKKVKNCEKLTKAVQNESKTVKKKVKSSEKRPEMGENQSWTDKKMWKLENKTMKSGPKWIKNTQILNICENMSKMGENGQICEKLLKTVENWSK